MHIRNRFSALKKRLWERRRLAAVLCGILLVCAVAGLKGLRGAWVSPEISGVKNEVDAFDDDDFPEVLLAGISSATADGRSFPVQVRILDGNGSLITSPRPGKYRLVYSCKPPGLGRALLQVETVLVVSQRDREAPVITGCADLTTFVGKAPSYRDGVRVTDNADPSIRLEVDAGQVDLSRPGTYQLFYSATDASGNTARESVSVVVRESAQEQPVRPSSPPPSPKIDRAYMDLEAQKILDRITKPGMTLREKAYAVYCFVKHTIHYVPSSNKSDWVLASYEGLVQHKGDCYHYFAASKLLLTRLGIPNADVQRVGGTSKHYWNLINLGEGYYHFDACPHAATHPCDSFMMTEMQARAYTQSYQSIKPNYYVYDPSTVPPVVGAPAEELSSEPAAEPTAEPTAEPAAEPTAEPAAEPNAEPEIRDGENTLLPRDAVSP